MTPRPEGTEGQRVLVTGGSGFIGTNVVEACPRDGWVVLNVNIASPKTPAHAPNWQQWTSWTTLPSVAMSHYSVHTDLVINPAAKTVLDERTTLDHIAANTRGVQNVIDAVQAAGSVERTFFTSSRLVCRLGNLAKDDTEYQRPRCTG